MRTILQLAICIFLVQDVLAQSPESINYQAVIRDSNGAILANQSVGLRVAILQGSATGVATYQETFNTTTSAFGLVALKIGTGTVAVGTFSEIDWANGPFFVETALDATGGTSYSVMGTSELLSVPFALHAKTAETAINDLVDDADANPTNEIELPTGGTDGQVLKTDGNGSYTWVNQTADTDTQLDETAVDGFVANNGYLTAEVDGSITNEIELPTGGTDGQVLKTDGSGGYTWVNQTADTDTQLDETTVDGFVANNGYLTAEVDGSITNEIELPTGGTDGQVLKTDGSGSYTWVDQTADTDTQLDETAVDGFVANNGYLTTEVDGSITNEIELPTGGTDGQVLKTDGSGSYTWVDQATADADKDTKIQVEESADEDIIRFDVAGTERWKMKGARLEAMNTGQSIFIGEGAGQNDDLSNNYNIYIGNNSGKLGTTSSTQNVAIGRDALSANTASINTAVGDVALKDNTTGSGNSAFGRMALTSNTTGFDNNAFGSSAMMNSTTGFLNSAFGSFALSGANTGQRNAAFGGSALSANTSGSFNTAVGVLSMVNNTVGTRNTVVGNDALTFNVAGSNATAIGYRAMQYADNTSTPFTNYNVAMGYEALRGSTTASANTGNRNTAIGYQSMLNNTSGGLNTGIGYYTLTVNTTGVNNVANGSSALSKNTTGSGNTAVGSGALSRNIDGSGNNAMGNISLNLNTSGEYNNGFGNNSLYSNTTGSNNIAMGQASLLGNTTGNDNVAIGKYAGSIGNGSGNIFLGSSAGRNETTSNKLYIENSNSTTPLIYGDFATDSLKVFGTLSVGDEYTLPAADGTANQVITTDGSGNASWQTAMGADDKNILNGTVVPITEGVNGDFYINTTTSDIYGPKSAGAWGSPTSLIGPTGPQGPAGSGGGSAATYRWASFHTYSNGAPGGWALDNNPDFHGGISPQIWTDNNGVASSMSSDKDILRNLFTKKGYAKRNAVVLSEEWSSYSSTNGQVVLTLFRIENTTGSPITWSPSFYYSCYGGWGERASVALNGVSEMNATSSGNATLSLSIPAMRTSTVIFVSTSGSPSGNMRNTRLVFHSDCLDLPVGLQFVDDLDIATGGWEQ